MTERLSAEEAQRADDLILGMGAQLTEACKSWKTYLELPWLVQRRLEELQPASVAEIKRRYFGTGSGSGR